MIINGEIIADENLTGDISQESSLIGDLTPESSLEGEVQQSERVAVATHPELKLRDLPDQHPQNAITNLAEDMARTPKDIITDAEIWNL